MFREWILLLASSLTAGYSMENALVQSYQELCLMFPKGGIMQEELKMMLAKAGNNQRPEILFDELAEKYPYEEVQSFAEVFKAARISGGSLQTVGRQRRWRRSWIPEGRSAHCWPQESMSRGSCR